MKTVAFTAMACCFEDGEGAHSNRGASGLTRRALKEQHRITERPVHGLRALRYNACMCSHYEPVKDRFKVDDLPGGVMN